MYFNLHLLSLMYYRGLSSMGFAVYWIIVLVVNFHAHSDRNLSDVEMMKRIGGQSSGYTCNTPTTCTGNPVNCDPMYPCKKMGDACDSQTTWYSPQDCNTAKAGNTPCEVAEINCVLCYETVPCTCQLAGIKLVCQIQGNTTYKCRFFNPGLDQCTFQPCPPGYNCQ